MAPLRALFVLALAAVASAESGCYPCASCAICSAAKLNPDGSKTVTISASGCKDGAVISWLACAGSLTPAGAAGCALAACSAGGSADGPKCNNVTSADYAVPAAATSLSIQLHDGKFLGTKVCGPKNSPTACFGGDNTACSGPGVVSGVCDAVVDLTTQACTPPKNEPPVVPECVADSDCKDAGACGTGRCSTFGTCFQDYAPKAGAICRPAAGLCDVAEVCDGATAECPADAKAPATQVCRDKAGPCDVAEACDGINDACPADAFLPATTVCRDAKGPCDVADFCPGAGAACTADAKAPPTKVCRDKAGPCDVAEACDGVNDACPADAFLPATTVCRDAKGLCDAIELCTGTSAACPDDKLMAPNTVCRANKDKCDVPEVCTGDSVECPPDIVKNHGYVYKCGITHFLCSVKANELVIGKGNVYTLGGCTLGTASLNRKAKAATTTVVLLDWPACMSQCINAICPNRKGLSHVAFFNCLGDTGAWRCLGKVTAAQAAPWPYCPLQRFAPWRA